MHTHVYVLFNVYIYIYTSVYIYIYNIYIYIYTPMYIYIYTCIHITCVHVIIVIVLDYGLVDIEVQEQRHGQSLSGGTTIGARQRRS